MPAPEEILALMPDRFDPAQARGLNVVVQFHLEGEAPSVHHVTIRDGAVEVARGVHPKPTMSLTLSGEDFVALSTGELTSQLGFMSRRIQIAGDVGMAGDLLALLGLGSR